LGLYSLHNGYDISKVPNLGHLLSSKIGDMKKRSIAIEAYDIKVPPINNYEKKQELVFFNWKLI
jgi:hypothetical protein